MDSFEQPRGGATGLLDGLRSASWHDGPGHRFVVDLHDCDLAADTTDLRGDPCPGCPARTGEPPARWWTVDEVVTEVRAAAGSVSGITVAGGEPTLQPTFVAALLATLADDPELGRLPRLVATHGGAPLTVWDRLAPHADGVLVHLAAFDPDVHEALTGRPLAPVLATIRHLATVGLLREVRMALVGGRTDDPATVGDAASWLAAVAPDIRVELTVDHAGDDGLHTGPPPDRLRLLAQIVEAAGLPRPVVV